jgi:hypothetical protein
MLRLQQHLERTVSRDNPLGDDVVTGGRIVYEPARSYPLSYWIFVGRELGDASHPEVTRP